MDSIKDLFRKFDANGNGKISKLDLQTVIKELDASWSDEDLERLFSNFDVDSEGRIDYETFLSPPPSCLGYDQTMGPAENWKSLLLKYDVKGDGTISKLDLRTLLKEFDASWSDDDLEQLFSTIDQDLDGRIYYAEFLRPSSGSEEGTQILHNGTEETIAPVFEDKPKLVKEDLPPNEVLKSTDGATGTSIATTAREADEEDDWSDEDDDIDAKLSRGRNEIGPVLQISIAPCTDVDPGGGEHTVAVSISVPDPEEKLESKTTGRVPSDVCCLIDISGSMGTEAKYEDENEQVKSDGLSYLDIVKHAVKTVIHMLGDDDRLALVAFDNNTEVTLPPRYMTKDGRKHAVEALDKLQPRGQTNIWAGLKAGLDALRTCENVGGLSRPKTILLLTDGVPNITPPRGHIAELRDYKECHPGFGFMINTFGFGYQLDSELLLDLSVEGHGTYAFIPDALIVGTSFVNSIANILSTLTQNAVVHLSAVGGSQFKGPVMGTNGQMMTQASWGRVVNLGPLQLGGTRELALPLYVLSGDQPYLEATVVYMGSDGKERQAFGKGTTRKAAMFSVCALGRGDSVDIGYEAIELATTRNQSKAQENMALLVDRLAGLQESPTLETAPWVSILQGDIAKRVTKALVGEARFNRWGKHYLRAFTRAHQIQYCTNFMDMSLQDYGGRLFRALRDVGDAVFVSLPPPTPSKKTPVQSQNCSSTRAAPNMSTYYGGSGGG